MSDTHAANQEAGNQEFDDLAATLCDGRITADQLRRLEQIASNDPVLLSTLVDLLNVDASLRQTSKGEVNADAIMQSVVEADVLPLASMSSDVQPGKHTKSFLQWASRHPKGPAYVVAATVLVAALVVMGLTPVREWVAKDSQADFGEKTANTPKFIAKLSNWHNDRWLEGTRPPRKDPRLRAGRRLVLESGFAEVTYFTGARVVIEGPAEFVVGGERKSGNGIAEIDSTDPTNVGYLSLGKLVARIEGEEAKGFVVETPSGSIEDLGTEFGVSVSDSGHTELHVTEGEVKLRVPAIGGRSAFARLVTADNAVRIAHHEVSTISFAPDRFASAVPLPPNSLKLAGEVILSDSFTGYEASRPLNSRAGGTGAWGSPWVAIEGSFNVLAPGLNGGDGFRISSKGDSRVRRSFERKMGAAQDNGATYLLQFQMQTNEQVDGISPNFKAMELLSGSDDASRHRVFQIGLLRANGNRGRDPETIRDVGFEARALDQVVDLGAFDTRVQRFVVKFSFDAAGDRIDIWRNPGPDEDYSGAGHASMTGLDVQFDRMTFAVFASEQPVHFDTFEIAIPTITDSPTSEEAPASE